MKSMVWSGVLLTLALSADGFVVGLHYGMRRIRLPWGSWAIIGASSALGMATSMLFGDVLAGRLSPGGAKTLGGALLIVLGSWQLLQGYSEYLRSERRSGSDPHKPLLKVRLRSLGLVVQILADPVRADADRSGTIDAREAALLGAALGADTLAAGIGVAMLGFGPAMILAVSLGLLALLAAGIWVGARSSALGLDGRGGLLPGLILVAAGLLQI